MRRLTVCLLTCVLLASCAATTPSGGQSTAPQPAATQPAAAMPTAATSYGTLPTSRTVEGYHVLGKAGAPITIVHYSDFL